MVSLGFVGTPTGFPWHMPLLMPTNSAKETQHGKPSWRDRNVYVIIIITIAFSFTAMVSAPDVKPTASTY